MGTPRSLRGLYGLALVPLLTDWLETGRPPSSFRESVTEIVLALAITAIVALVLRQHARIQAWADTDPATGLLNSRRLREDLARELARAVRAGHSLSVAYLDLDRFKTVNDRFGHARGDEVLNAFARDLEDGLRWGVDRAYRVGGDEFVVVLPGAGACQAFEILDRVRERSTLAAGVLGQVGAGMSVGVAERRDEEGAEALLRRADGLMFDAKNGSVGRRTPCRA